MSLFGKFKEEEEDTEWKKKNHNFQFTDFVIDFDSVSFLCF